MNEAAPTVEDDLAYLRRVVDSDRGARVAGLPAVHEYQHVGADGTSRVGDDPA